MTTGSKLRICGSTAMFMCPGCGEMHAVTIAGAGAWGFNGDGIAPTFTPSVLVMWTSATPPVTADNLAEYKRAPWPQTKVANVCHSHVNNGQITFLEDCTHDLRGQTVPLGDWIKDA